MKHRLTVVICVALAGGLLAACGGGDDDGGDALSEQEFQTRAQEICAGAQEEIASVTREAQQKAQGAQQNPGQIADILQESFAALGPILRDTVNEIGELTPPEDLQQELDDFVAQANEAADQIEDDPSKFAQQALGGENPFPELEQLGTDLGLQNCAQPDGGTG